MSLFRTRHRIQPRKFLNIIREPLPSMLCIPWNGSQSRSPASLSWPDMDGRWHSKYRYGMRSNLPRKCLVLSPKGFHGDYGYRSKYRYDPIKRQLSEEWENMRPWKRNGKQSSQTPSQSGLQWKVPESANQFVC